MKNKQYAIVLVLLLVSFLTTRYASSSEIILQESLLKHKIGASVNVFEDRYHQLDIDEILSGQATHLFSKSENENINFGFTESIIWIDFSLENKSSSDTKRVLEIAYPMLDYVTLFAYSGKSKMNVIKTGDFFPFTERDIEYRNFLFSMDIPANSGVRYVLRIESKGSLIIPLTVWSPAELSKRINKEQFLLGLYFGAIFIMVLYNSFLYITLRVETYLHYVFFMSSGALFLLTLSGISYQYIWPHSVWWANKCMPYFIFFCTTFCVSFARSFLDIKKNLPRYDFYIVSYIVINLLFICLSLFLNYATSIRLASASAVLAALLPLGASLALFKTSKQSRLYLLAWVVLIFGIIVYVFKTVGILPSTFLTEYSMMIGLILEVVLLSLGIGARINTIKKERMEAQKRELLAQQVAFEQQQIITFAYERFVPKRFLNLLGKNSILDVQLGDHVQKKMTILFSDIRYFTTISEKMTPKENFEFINSYLKRMEPIIEQNHGVIDKYIGDAIMALFEDANDAVNAAISLLDGLKQFNQDRQQFGKNTINIGVGINSGELMLGTIGAEGRMEGTVISDAVNLAARVESLTKDYDSAILISDNTYGELSNTEQYQLRVTDQVEVKGKADPIRIWEVL